MTYCSSTHWVFRILFLMRLWTGLGIIRCLILSIFFYLSELSRVVQANPAQVRSPVSLSAKPRRGPITMSRSWVREKRFVPKFPGKFFSQRKNFSSFSFSKSAGPFFVRLLTNFRIYTNNFVRLFHF